MDELFASLRAHLSQQGARGATWNARLLALLTRAHALDEEGYEEVWRPYLEASLKEQHLTPPVCGLAELDVLTTWHELLPSVPLHLSTLAEAFTNEAVVRSFALVPGMASVKHLDLVYVDILAEPDEFSEHSQTMPFSSIASFAEVGVFEALESLRLRDILMTPDDLALLVSSSSCAGLRSLVLRRCGVYTEGVERLVGGLQEQLWELDLHDNRLRSYGLTSLAQAPRLSALRSLRLERNGIRSDGLAGLARSPYITGLRELHLRNNSLDEDALRLITRSASLASLKSLDLSHNPIRDNGLKGFVESDGQSHLMHLEVLKLAHCKLGVEGFRWLGRSGALSSLRCLDLSYNKATYEGALALAEASQLGGLTHLSLQSTQLDAAGVIALVESPHMAGLVHLDVSNNAFRADMEEVIEAIMRSPYLEQLETLSLRDYSLEERWIKALLESKSLPRLNHVETKTRWYQSQRWYQLACSPRFSKEVRRRFLQKLTTYSLLGLARTYGYDTKNPASKGHLLEVVWEAIEREGPLKVEGR